MPQVIPTTVIGSFPQPDWLVDRDMLRSRLPPRVLAREVWRVPQAWLEQAQDDATLLAIREMEQAGIDVITDREMRRESYSNRFANALAGVDLDHPGEAVSRTGKKDIVPRIVGPIRRTRPVALRDLEFLRRNTDRRVKITVPGPFTMSQQAVDEHYRDPAALAMAFAVAVNEELRDLVAAGADVGQIDEPYLQSRIWQARELPLSAIEPRLAGAAARARAGLRDEVPAARDRSREAAGARRRRADRSGGAGSRHRLTRSWSAARSRVRRSRTHSGAAASPRCSSSVSTASGTERAAICCTRRPSGSSIGGASWRRCAPMGPSRSASLW